MVLAISPACMIFAIIPAPGLFRQLSQKGFFSRESRTFGHMRGGIIKAPSEA
jgi:hypothetical protein